MSRTNFGLALLVVLSMSARSHAGDWARDMFTVTNHDFGTVARGAETVFHFEFENKYVENVHVAGVSASCGCTTPSITVDTVKTWGKSAIVARFNTDRFMGRRSATITVRFDRPYYKEVQLTVTGYIRPDVVLHPGVVNFGELDQSQAAEQKVLVRYAGRTGWSITDVRSANPAFEVMLQPPQRSGNAVDYTMIVRLKGDAPTGYFKDELTIVTDDQRNQTLSLPVEGRVRAPLTVSPSSLFLGVLQPGQTVTKKLIVQSKQPSTIQSVDFGNNQDFRVDLPEDPTPKNVHTLSVTYHASNLGDVEQPIRVLTSAGSGESVATASVKE